MDPAAALTFTLLKSTGLVLKIVGAPASMPVKPHSDTLAPSGASRHQTRGKKATVGGFVLGDRCEAWSQSKPAYVSGTVHRDNGDGTYSVRYDDGAHEHSVRWVRPLSASTSFPSPPSLPEEAENWPCEACRGRKRKHTCGKKLWRGRWHYIMPERERQQALEAGKTSPNDENQSAATAGHRPL